MKSVCLITVFFANKWPGYFPYFLAGCEHNPDVNFLLFSDIKTKIDIQNVRVVYLKDLSSFNTIATQKLGLKIELVEAFKLCDLKPAYGKIFEDYLTDFDFWGYCDIDIILGNIRLFLTNEILANNDVVTVRSEYPAGFFSLYRNVPYVTSLYTFSRDYKAVFHEARHYCFDECNFRFQELVYNKQHISELELEIDCFAAVNSRLAQEGKIKYYNQTLVQEFIETIDIHCWKEGRVFNCVTKQEFLLIHLIHLKGLLSFVSQEFKKKKLFYISSKGLGHTKKNSFEYLKMYVLKIIRIKTNYFKWRIKYWLYFSTRRKVELQDKYCDNMTFALGSAKCTFSFTGRNKFLVEYDQNGLKRLEMGSIYAIKRGLFLYVHSNKLVLIKFLFTQSGLYKVDFFTIKDNRTEIGYLIKKKKISDCIYNNLNEVYV